MSFRTWLVTCTSLTMLALAPLGAAQAQDAATDPALLTAAQALQADPSPANRQALMAACIAAGYANMQDCFAALRAAGIEVGPAGNGPKGNGPGANAPEQPAPQQPASQAAPEQPAPQQPAPQQPAPEQPAPQQPASQQPAPQQAAPEQPAQQQAAPQDNAGGQAAKQLAQAVANYNNYAGQLAAGDPSAQSRVDKTKARIDQMCANAGFADTPTCLAQFGLTLTPLPAAPAAPTQPAPQQPAPEQPAPQQPAPQQPAPQQPASQAAPEQPAPQQPAPQQAAPQQPAPQQPAPQNNAGGQAAKQLAQAVANYNNYAGQLAAGDASAQSRVDKTKARIDQMCAKAGFADTTACLAQFGLSLTPLPNGPAPSGPVQPPISQMPNASEAVTPSAVEVLPSDVAPSEAAPILDSAKDQQNTGPGKRPNGPQGNQGQQPAQPQQPAGPPPQSDQAAQQNLPPQATETQSTQADKGKPSNLQFPRPVMPPQGGGTVVQPPTNDPNAVVINIGGVNIIINIKQDRDRYYDAQQDKITYEDLSRGRIRETVTRPNGVKIVTIYSRNGEVLQRSKILANGREIMISTYDPNANEDTEPFYIDPGADLPPLQLNIPASDYILDADSADEDEVTQFLAKPPVEQVRRIYTPDEVKHSARLRDSVRRLEIGNLTFDTGKATIARSQVGELATVADAMQTLLDKNPGEVFLIEGHTDAVGSDVSNLVLSDQRAATVARILTDFYDIPPENLVTQGYGERYLKVKTEDAEPLNRRVTVKRITPLVSYEAANQ